MSHLKVLTIAEQIAKHLHQEIMYGRWQELIPGRNELAKELGVNSKTVESALRQLEKEGVLIAQGAGKRRRIKASLKMKQVSKLRVALLLLDKMDASNIYIIELYHQLEEAGFTPFYSEKCMSELGTDTNRLAKYVKQTGADGWVIISGSRSILEWFSAHEVPAFAMFGRRGSLSIAAVGPDKVGAITNATDRLLELGHRRISLLCREQRRIPEPGLSERAFLGKLTDAGIETGKFNMPDWEESKDGFNKILDSLFGPTPPTALIVDEVFLFNAAYYYLTSRGMRIPEDVSLICTDNDPTFAWCCPSVSCVIWDYSPVVRRVVRWVSNISHGKKDLRQTLTKSEFVEGETIGQAK
jgi:DNA-binding LacI/PurR family transcriptional regulator|tara:strand:- start:526 stop:1590 length:1065 start_codon:yes stop_codon:yes gene_type:complete